MLMQQLHVEGPGLRQEYFVSCYLSNTTSAQGLDPIRQLGPKSRWYSGIRRDIPSTRYCLKHPNASIRAHSNYLKAVIAGP